MIEINLLPGGGRRPKRRAGAGIKLPRLPVPTGVALDRMTLFIAASWIIAPALILWLVLSAGDRREELELAIEQAQQDSARYAGVIESVTRLQARQDTIAQKLHIIQSIDSDRYVWAHLLDEISRALPAYTWLSAINAAEEERPARFEVMGFTGNNFALTEYLRNLEVSPFIRNVTLRSTEQVTVDDAVLYSFMLEATYEEPPPGAIETVPFFTADEMIDGAASE